MKTLSVGEFKAQFSEILELVKSGESVGILYGKRKQLVAMLVPSQTKKSGKRKLGPYDGKTKIAFADDFKMTEEEFTRLK